MPPDYVELEPRTLLAGLAAMEDAYAAAVADEGCGPVQVGPARTWADWFWFYRRQGLSHTEAAEAARTHARGIR